jgi:solute carrier family 35 protein
MMTIPLDAHQQGSWHISGACALVVFVVAALISLRSCNGNVDGKGTYFVIVFWMIVSAFMNLLNKQCTLLLQCPFTLVLIQMCISILFLARTPLTSVNKKDLWRWSALAVLFGMMLCSSMFAITHASVTCFLILRNSLPLLTLPVEKAVFGDSVPASATMVASLCIIGVGIGLYADFAPGHGASSTGLVWICINCAVSVVHRVLERYILTSDMKLSFDAMTLIYNVIPLLPVLALCWTTGEMDRWPEYTHLLHSPMAVAVIGCSGVLGLCLGQSGIMVQKCVTATSFMVLQTTVKIFIIFAAMVIFHDRFTSMSFAGCFMSLAGCGCYGAAQHSAKQASLEQQRLLPDWKKSTQS